MVHASSCRLWGDPAVHWQWRRRPWRLAGTCRRRGQEARARCQVGRARMRRGRRTGRRRWWRRGSQRCGRRRWPWRWRWGKRRSWRSAVEHGERRAPARCDCGAAPVRASADEQLPDSPSIPRVEAPSRRAWLVESPARTPGGAEEWLNKKMNKRK